MPLSAIGQFDVDSRWRICDYDAIAASEYLQTLRTTYLEKPQQARTNASSNYQSFQCAGHFTKELQLNMGDNLLVLQVGWLWLWTLLAALVVAGGGYLFKRYRQLLNKQQELSAAVEGLKEKLVAQSLNTSSPIKKTPQLFRERIENAINTRLGESAWRILNLIVNNPAITNKEIAAEVNLSLDGVSSSLRRMYATFEVGGSGNKKIILAQKAMEIIANSDSEVAKKE